LSFFCTACKRLHYEQKRRNASRDPLFAEGFSVFVGSNGSLNIIIRTANAPFSPPTFFSAPNVIQTGQFQHFAVTYSATNSRC